MSTHDDVGSGLGRRGLDMTRADTGASFAALQRALARHDEAVPQSSPSALASADGSAPVVGGSATGLEVVEALWLVTPTTRVLHHARLSPEQGRELVEFEWVDCDRAPSPIALSCGRVAWTVVRPDASVRRSGVRCEGCAAALGYPQGSGSPVSDPACGSRLAQLLSEVVAR